MVSNNKVHQQNYIGVRSYFQRLITNHRFENDNEDFNFVYEAERNFNTIMLSDFSPDEQVPQLQQWVNQYVSHTLWQRCLAALRQKAYKTKRLIKTIKIDWDTRIRLSLYAEENNLTLAAAINNLLDKVGEVSYL